MRTHLHHREDHRRSWFKAKLLILRARTLPFQRRACRFGKLYKILHKKSCNTFSPNCVYYCGPHVMGSEYPRLPTSRGSTSWRTMKVPADYFPWETIISIRNPTATAIKIMPITRKARFFCSGAGKSRLTASGCSWAGSTCSTSR